MNGELGFISSRRLLRATKAERFLGRKNDI
jgi:hypothetical protein